MLDCPLRFPFNASSRFEGGSRRSPQPHCRVERIELYEGPLLNRARELTDELTFETLFVIGATERLDHAE
jgi:hypothetical protein